MPAVDGAAASPGNVRASCPADSAPNTSFHCWPASPDGSASRNARGTARTSGLDATDSWSAGVTRCAVRARSTHREESGIQTSGGCADDFPSEGRTSDAHAAPTRPPEHPSESLTPWAILVTEPARSDVGTTSSMDLCGSHADDARTVWATTVAPAARTSATPTIISPRSRRDRRSERAYRGRTIVNLLAKACIHKRRGSSARYNRRPSGLRLGANGH